MKDGCIKPRVCMIIGVCLSLVLAANATMGVVLYVRPTQPVQNELNVKFLVIGDWGREGDYNQSLVADAMAAKAKQMGGVDFVISTGDNFYPSGVRCASDDTFAKSFTHVYHHQELQVPWHAVLGNHDYGETPANGTGGNALDALNASGAPGAGPAEDHCYYSPLHELDVGLVERDWRWHCQRTFQLSLGGGGAGAGSGSAAVQATGADLFFIDTTPFIQPYYDTDWAGNKGGLLEQSHRAMLLELESGLARSGAAWKVVVGHHPVRSNHRREADELLPQLEPLLEKYGAQAYFNGHDHNLQHIKNPGHPVHYLVSGAGSRVGGGFTGNNTAPLMYGGNGFVAVTLRSEEMAAEFVGLGGVLHTVRIPVKVE